MTRGSTRRAFVFAAAGLVTVAGASRLMSAVRGGVEAMRPAARRSSGAVCAACGRTGHTMLDRACPANPKVV